MTGTAKLYGGSLYELAAEEGLTRQLQEELTVLCRILKENPDYLRLLSEPSLPKAERLTLLDRAFTNQVHPYLLNFLKLLCENGSLREFSGCAREFQTRYCKEAGLAEAVVTSAVPLTEEQAAALTKKLQTLTGKTIFLTQKTDRRVIGGLKVELDGERLDGTAANQLFTLRKKITEIIV